MLFAEVDWAAILLSLATLVTAIGGVIVGIFGAIRSGRAEKSADKAGVEASEAKAEATAAKKTGEETQVNVQKIETATNSMKEALVKAAGDAGELKGREDQKADTRAAKDAAEVDAPAAANK